MAEPDEELLALRRRAYGPDADIHLDPSALRRLRHLEGSDRPSEVAPPPDVHHPDDVEPEPEPLPMDERDPLWRERVYPVLVRVYRRLRRVRRSNLLIALGATLVAACLIVAMALVQRVQTDPLQAPGATQVARLSVDTGYVTPSFFSAGGTSVVAFTQFHGLRALVSTAGAFAFSSDPASECLSIFSEAAMLESTGGGYSGFATGGCAAGSFPAVAQFTSGARELPDELRAAFPDSTAFQFVYDRTNHEVVVFATGGSSR
jgi:hypothetical protein